MIRPLRCGDVDRLLDVLDETRVFRPCELRVAREVLDQAVSEGTSSGYTCLVLEGADGPDGFACFGPTPCTEGTYDLYWIAVRRSGQAAGRGTLLLQQVEVRVRDAGGRILVAETSGSAPYEGSRRFYESRGFRAEARIADFYRLGDPKIVYVKPLTTPAAGR
jgi:GNAT superfamily N-acetyltransferase